MKPVVVLTTVGADFDARALAHALVEAKLAACVNIIDRIQSVYRWEGRVATDGEQLLVIKTVDDQVDALREELFSRHPYDVPEFVVLPIEGTSDAYGAWLLGAVAPS
ncbi:MAG TPA: divalent-cation tolerance protein CutA [Thermoanaerobaculia bacterium]|nr:divalent-cation tolerance protein CutA [Thermoanaerobaculia bacterium]